MVNEISGWWFGTCFFPIQLRIIIPFDELHHFSEGVGIPPTRSEKRLSTSDWSRMNPNASRIAMKKLQVRSTDVCEQYASERSNVRVPVFQCLLNLWHHFPNDYCDQNLSTPSRWPAIVLFLSKANWDLSIFSLKKHTKNLWKKRWKCWKNQLVFVHLRWPKSTRDPRYFCWSSPWRITPNHLIPMT